MSSMLVTTNYCCKMLPCILTTNGIPKTEAANGRLVSKCAAHIGSGKFLQWKTRLLQVTVLIGYNVFLAFYLKLLLSEVAMYSLHKWYAKNGSHKLTAGF